MAKGEVMEEATEEELAVIWSGYFCTLVGWGEHPGYNRDNCTQPTLEQCAEKADAMLVIYQQRRAG